MNNAIFLPKASLFGLDRNQCLEIEKNIMSIHPKHAPVRIPPPILSQSLKEAMMNECSFVTDMTFSIVDRIFAGNHHLLAGELGIDPYLSPLLEKIAAKNWMNRAKKFYRPDLLLTQSGLKMVENNIDTPLGGIGTADSLIEKFQLGAGVNEKQLQQRGIYHIPLTQLWLAVVAKLLADKKSIKQRKPVFFSAFQCANVKPEDDFSEVSYNAAIIKYGFTLLHGPLAELEVKGDKVTFKGIEIDVIYNNFSYTEFVESHQPFSMLLPLIDADEKGQVLFLSPPINMLFDNKAILSFLTAEQYSEFFTSVEWERLKKIIPETKILSANSYDSCVKNKNGWVLKPSFQFGGKGVFFGAEHDEATWKSLLDKALNEQFSSVLQLAVDDQQVIYDEDGTAINFCLGPFFFDEKFSGCFYREAEQVKGKTPVINVSRGTKYSAVYFSN